MRKNILIVGGAEAPEALERELGKIPGWKTRWVQEDEQAIETWLGERPDAVVLAKSLGAAVTRKLERVFEASVPGACVFQWEGGGEAVLAARMGEEFRRRQLARLGAIRVADTFDPGNQAGLIRLA